MLKKEIMEKLLPVTEEEQFHLNGKKSIERDIYMDSDKNIVIGKKLLKEGDLLGIRPHTRFVHFPAHSHDYIEMVYMCSGSTTHIINGESVVLKEGELLFLSRDASHEILTADLHDIAISFIVLPEFFDYTLQMLGDEETPLRRFIISCLKNKDSETAFLKFMVSDVLPVQNLVENLVYTLIYGTPNKRNINQTTMGLLFLQLLNCTDRLVHRNKHDESIVITLRYIEENYANGSLMELSKILHYDFSWFSREIKKRTGKNYTELVQEKRLSKAGFLLKNTDLNVSDISIQVGYDNVSYFHRLFRKRYGMSPFKFRKQ